LNPQKKYPLKKGDPVDNKVYGRSQNNEDKNDVFCSHITFF